MKKILGLISVFLLSVLLVASSAFAAVIPVSIDNTEIDGSHTNFWAGSSFDIKRGEDIEIELELTSTQDLEDVEVEATIRGYSQSDRESLTDIVGPFNMRANTTYRKSLSLSVPQRIDDDSYLLRITIYDKNHDSVTGNFNLLIDNDENEVVIKDVVFSPENGVKAGSALLTSVRVRNYGQYEEDVKVSVSIPALGVSASDYIDELEVSDSETSEELFIRIPQCAEAGVYDAVVTVEYDDGDEKVKGNYQVAVLEGETCGVVSQQPTTTVSGDTELKTAKVGEVITYPIAISNADDSAKQYAITVSSADWATFKVSPSNLVVVDGKDTKIVYLYVTPKEGSEGDKAFIANVKTGAELKQVALQASVIPSEETNEDNTVEKSGLKKSLEVGLIVLVVLLVILGLVIIFNKLTSSNDDDEDEDEEAQTYY
jgi:hypothetical protein